MKFLQVSETLLELIVKITQERSDLRSRYPEFYSLEMLRLDMYDRVLFCDSDMLFKQDVSAVIDDDVSLQACGDGSFYRGKLRDPDTFVELDDCSQPGMDNTFNSGFMLLNGSVVNAGNYELALGMLDPNLWTNAETLHTDQFLLNKLFAGQQTIIDGAYNFLIMHRLEQMGDNPTAFEDAKVLHFNGRFKPWMPYKPAQFKEMDDIQKEALEAWGHAFRKRFIG